MPQFNVAEAKALVVPGGRRKPGSAKGRIWMAPDFDRTPEDFEEYVR